MMWMTLLATGVLLAGCAELPTLRSRVQQQEKYITQLRADNDKFQAAYYEINNTLTSEKAKWEKSNEQLNRELEQAKNLKSKQEKELDDKLRTRNLEYDALDKEYNEQKTLLQSNIDELKLNMQTTSAERDAALARLTETEDNLRKEQARGKDLTQQVAALKVDVQSLTDQVAAVSADLANRDEALKTESENRASAEALLTQTREKMADTQGQLEKAQADVAALQASQNELQGSVDQLNKDKADLAAQIESVKAGQAEAAKASTDQAVAQAVEKARAEARKAALDLSGNPELKALADKIRQAVAAMPAKDGIEVLQDARGVRVILPSDLLFQKGTTVLADVAGGILNPLSEILKTVTDRTIKVEGHTDNQPIQDLPFADNWGLGFARADRVRELLMQNGVPSKGLTVLSRGDADPLTSNDTPEGRCKAFRTGPADNIIRAT